MAIYRTLYYTDVTIGVGGRITIPQGLRDGPPLRHKALPPERAWVRVRLSFVKRRRRYGSPWIVSTFFQAKEDTLKKPRR